MQNLLLQTLIGDSQLCISKTSPPGQRCIEPLQGVPDEYDTFNSSKEIDSEYFDAIFDEFYQYVDYEADAPSPFTADASFPFSASAPSPFLTDAPSPDFAAAPSPTSNTSALPDDDTLCVNMACSTEGRVVVNGKPCDPGASFAHIYLAVRNECQRIYKLDVHSQHEKPEYSCKAARPALHPFQLPKVYALLLSACFLYQ
jgi:hypothetical protein